MERKMKWNEMKWTWIVFFIIHQEHCLWHHLILDSVWGNRKIWIFDAFLWQIKTALAINSLPFHTSTQSEWSKQKTRLHFSPILHTSFPYLHSYHFYFQLQSWERVYYLISLSKKRHQPFFLFWSFIFRWKKKNCKG